MSFFKYSKHCVKRTLFLARTPYCVEERTHYDRDYEMEWNGNNSTTTSHYKRYDLYEVLQRPKVALIFSFLVFLDLLTLVGNGMVIWTVFKTRRLRFSAFYFVTNLAVADFLVGLVVLPISLAYHISFEMEGQSLILL